ncbi:MAG: chromophore lyase CpcT/CpeT [Bacteroidota bacterium]|nr:MAG: chromophore lyase CpcT/CpeT [Bacteroidota bacterium]
MSHPKRLPRYHTGQGISSIFQVTDREFSSQKQSLSDTSYFNIHLSMCRIWNDRTDGIWLYVEQAVASSLNKPYRQRVYKLTHTGPDEFSSEIFTLKNAKDVIGLAADASKMQLLQFEHIEAKNGCTVILKRNGSVYTGGTQGTDCSSDLRGAAYATTKITLVMGNSFRGIGI